MGLSGSSLPSPTFAHAVVCSDLTISSAVLSSQQLFNQQSIQSARLYVKVPIGSTPIPFWVQGRRHTCLRGKGWGGPIPTKGNPSTLCTIYYNLSTVHSHTSLFVLTTCTTQSHPPPPPWKLPPPPQLQSCCHLHLGSSSLLLRRVPRFFHRAHSHKGISPQRRG
jgi:hypothetical protein